MSFNPNDLPEELQDLQVGPNGLDQEQNFHPVPEPETETFTGPYILVRLVEENGAQALNIMHHGFRPEDVVNLLRDAANGVEATLSGDKN